SLRADALHPWRRADGARPAIEALAVEGRQDRAGSWCAGAALRGELLQVIPRALHVRDLFVEQGDPGPGEFACPLPIVSGIEHQELPDFLEREPGALRRSEEH